VHGQRVADLRDEILLSGVLGAVLDLLVLPEQLVDLLVIVLQEFERVGAAVVAQSEHAYLRWRLGEFEFTGNRAAVLSVSRCNACRTRT